jgi:hypothetical protein
MPKAPSDFEGYASVYRQHYFRKNIISFYDYINDLEYEKDNGLDKVELLYVESFKRIGMKEECIHVWYYDEQLVYKTYMYLPLYDLYISDDDKLMFFIDVHLTEEDYQEMSIKRSKMIIEELVQKVYHPTNVMKYLALGYHMEDL